MEIKLLKFEYNNIIYKITNNKFSMKKFAQFFFSVIQKND